MPIVTTEATYSNKWAPVVRFPNLPDFNVDGQQVITELGTWYSRAVGAPVLVANGGGAGAVAIQQPPAERYLPVAGRFRADDSTDLRALLGLIYEAFADEAPLVVVEPGGGERQIFVMLHDTPADPEMVGPHVNFTLPLVAADPFRYALTSLSGTVGAFTGQTWFETFADDGSGTWFETFADDGAGTWFETYQQAESASALPDLLVLDSAGDVSSRRLTVEVTGPVGLGDWWLVNETSGARLWAEIEVRAGQTLTFDCRRQTASLDGVNVDHLVFGDYLTLEPGSNTFRLVTGSATAGMAHFDALEAHS